MHCNDEDVALLTALKDRRLTVSYTHCIFCLVWTFVFDDVSVGDNDNILWWRFMFKFISLTSGHVMNQAYVSKYDETFDDETSDRKQGSDSHAQPEVPSIWRKNMHQEKKNCPWSVPSGYPNPTRYPVFLSIPDPTRFSFGNHRVAGNPKHRVLPDISGKPEVSGTTRYFGYHP